MELHTEFGNCHSGSVNGYIGIATNDVKFIEAAMDAADRLWNFQDLAFGNSGLLVGESGVGYLYLCIGWLTGEQDWYERALYLANNLDSIEGASPDIYHGNSGRGLFHTWLFQETGSSAHKDIALNIFNYLIKTVQNTPFGPLWKIPEGYLDLSGHQFFGMAHGSAGIGLFLIEMAKELGFEPAADLAESIGNGLIQAEKDLKFGKHPIGLTHPVVQRGGIWCHGSAGIGLFLTQLYLLNKQSHFLDAARRALELSVLDLPYVGATQCHGLAGILESLLTINEVDSDVNWATAITNVKYRLRHYFSKEFENGPMICSELPSNFTPEFMVGSSGAASALARSISKGRLGYFLSNPRDGFKPADLTSLPRQM